MNQPNFRHPLGMVVLLALCGSAAAAEQRGVTDSEIRIGQTMPYSGPLSAYSALGKAEIAYFNRVNDRGGINGRKVKLISLDDGYVPPRTVEQTRRLVESDEVALIFSSLGTAQNNAIAKYLQSKNVPQLFLASGASKFADVSQFPQALMGIQAPFRLEARLYARHAVEQLKATKIKHSRLLVGRCESAYDLTPSRLPTVTLVRRPINSSTQCVAVRGLGSDLHADRASDPAPNNMPPSACLFRRSPTSWRSSLNWAADCCCSPATRFGRWRLHSPCSVSLRGWRSTATLPTRIK
jgi:hypothetical protein